MKQVTPLHVALIAILLTAVIVSNIYAPTVVSSMVGFVGIIIAWLTRAPQSGQQAVDVVLESIRPPRGPSLVMLFLCAGLSTGAACGALADNVDADTVIKAGGSLSKCQAVGDKTGSYKAYQECVKGEGL